MQLRIGAFFASLLLAGCGVDIGGGSQFAGQRCFQDSDCAGGLSCVERVCTPTFGGGPLDPDAGNNTPNNVSNNENNQPPNNVDNNRPDPVDMGPDPRPCAPGERRCLSEGIAQICFEDGSIREEECAPDEFCEDGFCLDASPECRDNDRDGYGRGCRRGEDCNDRDPLINPGMPEFCGNRLDDNCDGAIDERCPPDGCCPNGCAPNEFCTDACVCQPFDQTVCQFQNQPCVNEGEFFNGYFCVAFTPGQEPRCWGICQINADDPDATCPDPTSVCAFDSGDGQNGICASTCDADAAGQRACDQGLGCLQIETLTSDDGICVPTNEDNQVGDFCDPDNIFDCADGLVCIQGFGGRGRCREACRPFANGGMGTDCDQGHCLPFSEGFGVCFPDNMSTEGENCGPQFTACNADAVGCYDAGGSQQCLRLCRLSQGNDDCADPNQGCNQIDMNQTEIGVCF